MGEFFDHGAIHFYMFGNALNSGFLLFESSSNNYVLDWLGKAEHHSQVIIL